jgi:hypothetical protein
MNNKFWLGHIFNTPFYLPRLQVVSPTLGVSS